MKPIIFSTQMVQAILSGQKTQTRRVVKRPKAVADVNTYYPAKIAGWWWWCAYGYSTGIELRSPYGYPGQELWVREALTCIYPDHDGEGWVAYETDGRMVVPDSRWWWQREYLPSIFMPRWACRLFLKITEVRVERVQDISPADCVDEGIEQAVCLLVNPPTPERIKEAASIIARDRFRELWDSINAKRGFSWESNPWVWVIGFEVVK